MIFKKLIKRALICPLFFLTSCSTCQHYIISCYAPSCPQEIYNQCINSYIKKKVIPSSELCFGLDTEIYYLKEDTLVYFTTSVCYFEPLKHDPEKVQVDISIDDKQLTAQAFLLKGKQKVLLSKEDTHTLLLAFSQNKKIHIKINMFQTTLTPPFP